MGAANRSFMACQDYAAAWTRLQELRAEVTKLEWEREDVSETLRSLRGGMLPSGERTQALARSLLSSADAGDPVPATVDVGALQTRLAEIGVRLPAVRAAVPMQETVVHNLEVTVSARICREVRPDYVAVLRNMARAITLLNEAAREEDELRKELVDGRVRLGGDIRPMPLRGFRATSRVDRTDKNVAELWLEEVAEYYPELKKR